MRVVTKNLCMILCIVLATSIAACGGNGDSKSEQDAENNSAAPSNNTTPGEDTNNTAVNNAPSSPNDTANNTDAPSSDDGCNPELVCESYCKRMEVECLTELCSGTVTVHREDGPLSLTMPRLADLNFELCMAGDEELDIAGCIPHASTSEALCEETRAHTQDLKETSCEEFKLSYCRDHLFAGLPDFQDACNCPRPTNISGYCWTNDDCDGGVLDPLCLRPEDEGEGEGEDENGHDHEHSETPELNKSYCSASGCEILVENGEVFPLIDPRCGRNNAWCLPNADSSADYPYGVCVAGCSNHRDCQIGEVLGNACQVLFKTNGHNFGYCFPRCHDDWECQEDEGDQARCNREGVCERGCDSANDATCLDVGGKCIPSGEQYYCSFE